MPLFFLLKDCLVKNLVSVNCVPSVPSGKNGSRQGEKPPSYMEFELLICAGL